VVCEGVWGTVGAGEGRRSLVVRPGAVGLERRVVLTVVWPPVWVVLILTVTGTVRRRAT
jgi:hypothetical protein